MVKLTKIEGIGRKYAKELQRAGVSSQESLLKTCAKRRDRDALAEETHISKLLILKWTNQADLSRINGIGEEYSELLERSGVDSVPELAQRRPEHLLRAMKETNEQLHLVRHMPGLRQIEHWIKQAKALPRAVFH